MHLLIANNEVSKYQMVLVGINLVPRASFLMQID